MTFGTKLSAATLVAALLTIGPAIAASSQPQANDVTTQFAKAGLNISDFQAVEIGGIVVLRGATDTTADAARATAVAESLGYGRVANLVRIVDKPDDAAIQRAAERHLSVERGLDGCDLRVASHGGVVTVSGRVQYELQKDLVASVMRGVDGVREVKMALYR